MNLLIINKCKNSTAVMILFFLMTSMSTYAQVSKDTGNDLAQKPPIAPGDAKDASRTQKSPIAPGDAKDVSKTQKPPITPSDTKYVRKKEVATPVVEPVIKIKKLENNSQVYSFELKDADIRDIFRVLAYDYKLNLLVDSEVEGKITATMSNISLEQFLESVAESLNLIIENNSGLLKVKPNLITKTFVLKHIEAQTILMARPIPAGVKGESSVYDLLSGKGKIFLSRQPNSIMVIDYPPNIGKIEHYFEEIDRKVSSQVFKLKYLKASDIVGSQPPGGSSQQGPGGSSQQGPGGSSQQGPGGSSSVPSSQGLDNDTDSQQQYGG